MGTIIDADAVRAIYPISTGISLDFVDVYPSFVSKMVLPKRQDYVLNDVNRDRMPAWTLYKNDYTGVDLFNSVSNNSANTLSLTPTSAQGMQEFINYEWTTVNPSSIVIAQTTDTLRVNTYNKNGYVYINIVKNDTDRLFRFPMTDALFFFNSMQFSYSKTNSVYTFRTDVFEKVLVG